MLKYVLIVCGIQKSCFGDKAAPTCDAANNVCICGLNDLNGDGAANVPLGTCAGNQQAPTCSDLGQIDNPANFQCVCGANGPCKAGTICEKDVNGKEKCVVKCPVACPGTEQCDIFHRICRCGVSTSCENFPRAPVCGTNAANQPACICTANAACPVGERC